MSGESLDDHFTKKKKKSTSSKHKPVEEPTKSEIYHGILYTASANWSNLSTFVDVADDELEIAELKNFDLNSKFGPCYGTTHILVAHALIHTPNITTATQDCKANIYKNLYFWGLNLHNIILPHPPTHLPRDRSAGEMAES